MGSGSNMATTQTQVGKQPRCSVCNETPAPDCAWQQGRCPHRPSMLDQILADPYRSRFYNLFKFFTGRR
jgi:hypothetical protein